MIFEDNDKTELSFGARGDGVNLLVKQLGDDEPPAFCLEPRLIPDVIRELCEKAGVNAPVVLARPAPRGQLVPGPHGDELVEVSPSYAGSPANLPGVMLGLAGGQMVRLTGDEPLRVALALVDAMKDAADDDVFTLASVLAAHPDATFPELARAVLADGRFGRLDGAR